MSRPASFYLSLVPPQHAQQPRFTATVDLSIEPYVSLAQVTESLPVALSLDSAVGPQLDAVGARVNLSRRVTVPFQQVYFSFDDPARGWERGTWYDSLYGDDYAVTLLDDNTYRQLIRAKVLSDNWDGTLPQAQAIVEAIVSDPGVLVFVDDSGSDGVLSSYFAFDGAPGQGWDAGAFYPVDLATNPAGDVPPVAVVPTASSPGLVIGVAGRLPPLAVMFAMEQQLVPVKPAGKPTTYSFTSVYGAPLFGFDVENEYISGFDVGAWGVSAQEILDAPPGVVYPLNSGD